METRHAMSDIEAAADQPVSSLDPVERYRALFIAAERVPR
jgi:hypothetical protein